ncbi:hypothetical protein NEIRO03_2534 [Nematocida sp. AWRm78]|nr:hypothetical protein NEIRO03_2534 [Nematocida sp. AWRm78]
MPRHLIGDAHEWSNEIPAVPTGAFANLQPRERAWDTQRGKKTLLSLTLARPARPRARRSEVGDLQDHWRARRPRSRPGGEFGWGGTPARPQRGRPKAGSGGKETTRGAQGQMPA